MTTQIIQELSPAKLNTTKLAIDDLTIGPGIAKTAFGHSGNRFPSIINVDGADRVISFKTPFLPAYNLIGFVPLALTNLEFLLAKFTSYVKDPTSVHDKLAGSLGMAVITGATVSQRGVLMADVSVVPLLSDGMTDPLALTSNNALYALDAEPTLHTLGSCLVNGTKLDGVKSSGLALNHGYSAEPTSGALYPQTAALLSGDPELTCDVESPHIVLTTLGLLGAALSSSAVWYYRAYIGGVVAATGGISLTMASGLAMPNDLSARHRGKARQGVSVVGLSSTDGTHPVQLATGVAVP